jgi:ElaB/YqjD/DUF883 family membrane-anchored ribosome-binding protein
MNARAWVTAADGDRGTTDKVMADLRMLAADTELLLKATAGQTGDQIAQVRARAEESLQGAKLRIAGLQDAAVASTRAAGRAVDGYVHANPWQTMAICAVAGLALGFVLSSGGGSDS